MAYSLAELAQRFGLELKGDGAVQIRGACSLQPGEPGCIGFLANPKLREQLAGTRASAVIVGKRDAATLAVPGLIAPDPHLAFARIAALFEDVDAFVPGVHPTAAVDPSARLGEGVHVGAQAVIDADAEIGAGAFVGPGCVVRRGARIGAGTRLEAQVFVGMRVRIGERCRLLPGAVVGSRGFGLARSPAGWEEVPQLGGVVIGNDVEIGASTTIDRGALGDTVLEDGVKLDNQIQVAHNVRIGAHTAIAACTGIAGSATIGRRCMIGGASVINGHIDIVDDVVILGFAMVTKSVTAKGIYGSGLPLTDAREWRRSVARFRRLDTLEERLKTIEKQLNIAAREDDGDPSDDV